MGNAGTGEKNLVYGILLKFHDEWVAIGIVLTHGYTICHQKNRKYCWDIWIYLGEVAPKHG
jgi:hypothetical protein